MSSIPDARVEFYVVGGPVYSTPGSEYTHEDLVGICERFGASNLIKFLGFASNHAQVFSEMDVIVHSSTLPEPFGRTIVEGMAAGKCAIASREGGATELISDGVDGLYFEARNAESLCEQMISVINNPKRRAALGAAANESAQRRFGLERLAKEVSALYREILKRKLFCKQNASEAVENQMQSVAPLRNMFC